jgi:uncharacterized membrane protein
MEEMLKELAHYATLSLEAVAILLIVLGAIEAVIGIVRVSISAPGSDRARREVWLKFARWLVAGMTFQLASDVISTSFEPSMEHLVQVGVIAVIRTFLSFFLDKEMESKLEMQEKAEVKRASRQPPAGE